MRLKRLEVQGFKSFADRTEFAFEPGLTGVVGPNGCGKSNVVDAIKWVLGETRPTTLRGSEMQDVIFKGTAARPALGFAEVTLILDNSDGAVDGLSEIALTRRLFRTGEGEYLLNRETARRKDLKHLLFDTGLGVNAYSILEQGKIDAILSANAVDRRAVFEEAAGITRFRFDRREACRRLETTEKNLESVRAVLVELERQRGSLRAQASRARRHSELTAQIRGWRAAAAVARWRERLASRDAAAAEVARCGALELEAREARDRAQRESRTAHEEARTFAAEEARLSSELGAIRADEGRSGERATGLREKASRLEGSAADKRARAASIGSDLGRLRDERAEAERQLEQTSARLVAAESDLEARSAALLAANERYRACGRDLEDGQRALLQAIEARTVAQNALAGLEVEERATAHEDERLGRKVAELESEVAKLGAEREGADGRVASTARRVSELRADEGRLRAALDSAEGALSETESRLAEVERRLSGLQSRAAVLRELDAGLAGLGAGAKAVLAARLPGVVGLLADKVRAPLAVAAALEAALGERASAVLAESSDAAASALGHVRDKKAGRVALVLAGEAASSGDADATRPLPIGAGVVGPLLDHVKVDPTIAASMRRLLAGVVLVETLDHARRLAPEHRDLVFVTRAGERVDAASVAGGIVESASTPISRRSAIAAIDAEVAGAKQERALQETLRERAQVALVQARADEA
ncbi:MAG TPA: AAA family ATPase, partial [Planctomycetota bacterium]|nr:AAA family ATPase [Planctomycetota bacterium]